MDKSIKVANYPNYTNPCRENEMNMYLISHVNQNDADLIEKSKPIVSNIGMVNNAASTNAPHKYYTGLQGGCLQSDNPDVNPVGGNWINNCSKSLDRTHSYSLDNFFNNSDGKSTFNDEQKAVLLSLNEEIPGFNQLHINNEQFCQLEDESKQRYYVEKVSTNDSFIKDAKNEYLTEIIKDGVTNPTESDCEENDILCKYYQCEKGKHCKNPLFVKKDIQQYKQTIDGQFLDGIGKEAVRDKINAEWGGDAELGICASPGDINCRPDSVVDKTYKLGVPTTGNKLTDDLIGKFYSDNIPSNANEPSVTTQGKCYFSGVGAFNSPNNLYDPAINYHDRFTKSSGSPLNVWNDMGATAYGMMEWKPEDNSNDITRILDRATEGRDFDLSPYKVKCGDTAVSSPTIESELPGLDPLDYQQLVCPMACPFDSNTGKCLPRAVCGSLTEEHKELGLLNYESPGRPCPEHCPASPGSPKYCTTNEKLVRPICPPMGKNYSLVGRTLGMVDSPKHNSAFFHNRSISMKNMSSELFNTASAPGNQNKDFYNIFTSIESIGRNSPSQGFDSEGFYQMQQGLNIAEPILCEYNLPDNYKSQFVDAITDPRQVSWFWDGTVGAGLPPQDPATGMHTLGLYIRGKTIQNPQQVINLNPNSGSIVGKDSCSPWQDEMVDICMNHEVDKKYCYRPSDETEKDKSVWEKRYLLDIPPPTASPSTNTSCPVLMSKPQIDVWKDYYGLPEESMSDAINSEYYIGKYCKDWYRGMGDTYSSFTDKGADVAAQKFNEAATEFCRKDNAAHRYNFECGCINADLEYGISNNHSEIVSAMQQGGPQGMGADRKYCYLGACDVGSVGSLQHDRLIDPRYGSWSYPEAPIFENPNGDNDTRIQKIINTPCYSPSPGAFPGSIYKNNKEAPCWLVHKGDPKYTLPIHSPAPMCPTPKCEDLVASPSPHVEHRHIPSSSYTASVLQKCPNYSCSEMIMTSGSVLENVDINHGISICQRHGTNIDKRWKYDPASGKCIYTEEGDSSEDTARECDKHGGCNTLTGNTNNPYMYASKESCDKAKNIVVNKTPRTSPPPPVPRNVFTDRQTKWSCTSNNKCESALGIGEYTSEKSCEEFCSSSHYSIKDIIVIIIIIGMVLTSIVIGILMTRKVSGGTQNIRLHRNNIR